jgi:hypothetical protein
MLSKTTSAVPFWASHDNLEFMVCGSECWEWLLLPAGQAPGSASVCWLRSEGSFSLHAEAQQLGTGIRSVLVALGFKQVTSFGKASLYFG